MDLKSYLTSNYLFQINTAYVSPQEKLFFLGGVILILLAIVTKISAKLAPTPVDAKYRRKFYYLFLTTGIWEVVWYLCRYEDVNFFGSRFIVLLGLLIALIWFIKIAFSTFRNYTKEKTIWQKEQVRLRYLPN